MAKQITTFIPNIPGALASFCRILKMHGIDMRAMNVGDAMEFGIVRVIASDTDKAVQVLTKEHFVCQVEDVIVIDSRVRLWTCLPRSVRRTSTLTIRTRCFPVTRQPRDSSSKRITGRGL